MGQNVQHGPKGLRRLQQTSNTMAPIQRGWVRRPDNIIVIPPLYTGN